MGDEAKPLKTFERMPAAAPTGGFLHVGTPEQVAAQRSILLDLIKSLGKNLLAAKNLTAVTLPVIVFEPRSYLQRLCDGWWSAPIFLKKAAETEDPVERFKLVITFVMCGFHNTCAQLKPFNPILGETYQARYEDGTTIFCEQSSHHPPVTNWQLFGPNNEFQVYGYGEWTAGFRGNTVIGHQKGPNYVSFGDGTVIEYSLPAMNVSGIIMGDRIIEYVGTIEFRDERNHLACDIVFNPKEAKDGGYFGFWSKQVIPSDHFKGTIVRVTESLTESKRQKRVEEPLCIVQGSWLGCIEFDEEKYWDFKDEMKIYETIPVEEPLPSDCRYREDIKYLAQEDLEKSTEIKSQYEDKQRKEARLRKEGEKERKNEKYREPKIFKKPELDQLAKSNSGLKKSKRDKKKEKKEKKEKKKLRESAKEKKEGN